MRPMPCCILGGQITEVGSHDSLMAITGGDYRSFVTEETMGTEEDAS